MDQLIARANDYTRDKKKINKVESNNKNKPTSNTRKKFDKNKNYSYYEHLDHEEPDCFIKFPEIVSKAWRENNQAIIAYLKKKNAKKFMDSINNNKITDTNKGLAVIQKSMTPIKWIDPEHGAIDILWLT